MDVTRPGETAGAALRDAGDARAAALAAARQRAGAERLQSVDAAQARQAENFAKARDAISRALGANTKLSITKAEGAPVFVYQAIDVNSGKVVNEWPHQQFVDMLNSVEPGAGDQLAGLVIDKEA